MVRKLGVSRIVSILFYNPLQRVPEEILAEGTAIHNRLGFSGTTTYRRFYEFEGELYEIIGMPDRITEDGYVEELKTSSRERVEKALEIGKTQANILCWLTGLRKYKVYVYSPREGKYLRIEEGVHDPLKCREDLEEGIRRIKWIESLYKQEKMGTSTTMEDFLKATNA